MAVTRRVVPMKAMDSPRKADPVETVSLRKAGPVEMVNLRKVVPVGRMAVNLRKVVPVGRMAVNPRRRHSRNISQTKSKTLESENSKRTA